MLEIMRARAPEVEAVKASGTSLPFEDDRFDLVLTVAALHHIADPADVRRTLTEMVRVCKPSGAILIWDHNPRNPYWSQLMARVPQDTGDERLIPESEIVSGLRPVGRRSRAAGSWGWCRTSRPPRALRAAAALERLFERTPVLQRSRCAQRGARAQARRPLSPGY